MKLKSLLVALAICTFAAQAEETKQVFTPIDVIGDKLFSVDLDSIEINDEVTKGQLWYQLLAGVEVKDPNFDQPLFGYQFHVVADCASDSMTFLEVKGVTSKLEVLEQKQKTIYVIKNNHKSNSAITYVLDQICVKLPETLKNENEPKSPNTKRFTI